MRGLCLALHRFPGPLAGVTVHFSYGGNWTALYCTGALFKPPPDELRPEHIYIFANSNGYDGQVYH